MLCLLVVCSSSHAAILNFLIEVARAVVSQLRDVLAIEYMYVLCTASSLELQPHRSITNDWYRRRNLRLERGSPQSKASLPMRTRSRQLITHNFTQP